ncbi:hypothetical protein H6P81_004753 [Aristolochia fimbriata]|uniref:Uncharacterized protein n=1 Tax=Aristolochia fimbriata TaxID=158543 RepID=A0AAV7ETG9_ARIFI|nr:hypothetical protein H6P81_004753 [Aristolochia fimbriata]
MYIQNYCQRLHLQMITFQSILQAAQFPYECNQCKIAQDAFLYGHRSDLRVTCNTSVKAFDARDKGRILETPNNVASKLQIRSFENPKTCSFPKINNIPVFAANPHRSTRSSAHELRPATNSNTHIRASAATDGSIRARSEQRDQKRGKWREKDRSVETH